MRQLANALTIGVLIVAITGCSSGGNSTLVCSLDNPAALAPSAWPKFRHDPQNTGHVENSLVAANMGTLRWAFPPLTNAEPKGPFAASPVLNGEASDPASATRVYLASTDGYLYAVNPDDGTEDTAFAFRVSPPITSTPLVGTRNGEDAIFFGGGNGLLYGLDAEGVGQATNWPATIGGFVGASPNINGTDGTVYAGSLSGLLFGVCPNGVGRFFLSTGGTQSSPAIGPDDTVYIGTDDHQLRALRPDGVILWAFSTSAPILNAPVVEVTDGAVNAIYVADRGGRIFKVSSNGRAVSGFDFVGQNGAPVGPIASSPALAENRLYVGSDDGNLYAVDAESGAIIWQFTTGAAIVSSPAVATGAAQPFVVVGSNDGTVYFIRDDGPAGTLSAAFDIGAAVRSSPAIGGDGTVYVGADDGRVYAIQ